MDSVFRCRLLGVCLFCCFVCLFAGSPTRLHSASGITAPSAKTILSGTVAIHGVAEHPAFRKWQVDLVLDGEDGHATFLALGEEPVQGELFRWDTRAYPDGDHQLRLRVVHSNLNYEEYFVPVTLRNGNDLPSVAVAPPPAAQPQPEESTAPIVRAAPTPPARQPVDAERWIEIDISDQRLIAWDNDQAIFDYTVSTGKPGFRTLPGSFAVYQKYEETRMRGYDYDTPDVPWTMYYSGAFAIHGAYWHEDFGTPVSHGCVNLPVEQAKALYEWADVGTLVVVRQ